MLVGDVNDRSTHSCPYAHIHIIPCFRGDILAVCGESVHLCDSEPICLCFYSSARECVAYSRHCIGFNELCF